MKENKNFITAEEAILNKSESLSAEKQSHKNISHKKVLYISIFSLFAVIFLGTVIYSNFFKKSAAAPKVTIKSTNITTELTRAPEGWIPYKNLKYGYELRYPKNWVINNLDYDSEINAAQSVLIHARLLPKSYVDDLPNNSVHLEVLAIPVPYTFQQWWSDHLQQFAYTFEDQDFSDLTFPRDKVQLDGYDENNNYVYKTNILWKDNFVYILTIDNKTPIDKHSDTFKTFESLNPKPNKELLDWNIYTKNQDFTIEIPNLAQINNISEELKISDSYEGRLDRCGCGWNISIKTESNSKMLTIPEWYKEQIKGLDEHSLAHAGDRVNIDQIGKYPGYSKRAFGGDKSIITHYIARGNKIFAITYNEEILGNVPEDGWQQLIYKKIIASFTFKKT